MNFLESITLKYLDGATRKPLTLHPGSMTILVGPNNSGKSRLLQEVYHWCCRGEHLAPKVVMDSVRFRDPTDESEASRWARSVFVTPVPGESISRDGTYVGRLSYRRQVHSEAFINALNAPNYLEDVFARDFLSLHTLKLDASGRLGAVKQQPAGRITELPKHHLDVLFRDDNKRERVRLLGVEAFGMHFVIDPTEPGKFGIRYSKVPPESPKQERSLDDDAVKFHAAALDIAYASDGVKAFTGIIAELIAGDPSIVLVDEPEAFLHPSLAFKLGKNMATIAAEKSQQVIAATHSAHFVMGCIQSGTPVEIVRLTNHEGEPLARRLPKDDLVRMMRHPLLRSTGVLEGVFYESVVVTEADADRAFYQEVNERLLAEGRGIPNCLFLNAQNKQTVKEIVAPLRALGIPAATIVDIDVLKEGGKTWTSLLEACGVPGPSRHGLANIRSQIMSACTTGEIDMKRAGGVEALAGDLKNAASDLLDQLAKYGLFVVPGGELESWLPGLGVGTGKHGPAWLIEAFEKMGDDPADPSYAKPIHGDVWAFMDRVGRWSGDAQRKGV